MSILYTVINTSTGQITRSGYTTEIDYEKQAHDGEMVIKGQYNDSLNYWDIESNKIKQRPKMSLSISSKEAAIGEEITITGIPEGTVFLYGNGEETIDDGEVEWSSNVAGHFEFVLSNFPYQTEVIQVEVTA